jgi:cytochrome c oxidase subunit 3
MEAGTAKAEYGTKSKIHSKKFALWVACASITMMFAAFTSSYLVRRAAGNWLEFPLPIMFYYSTAAILASSIFLHLSYRAFKAGREIAYKRLLVLSFLSGFIFIVLQYAGWLALQGMGVSINTNPSGSFVYVISGVHAAHVLGGIAALTVALLHAFLLPFKATAGRILRFELTLTYWHFVDVLWVYLFIFFLIQS